MLQRTLSTWMLLHYFIQVHLCTKTVRTNPHICILTIVDSKFYCLLQIRKIVNKMLIILLSTCSCNLTTDGCMSCNFLDKQLQVINHQNQTVNCLLSFDHLYIKEFNVVNAWSKCESSFCVDRGRDRSQRSVLLWIFYVWWWKWVSKPEREGHRRSTFCRPHEKAMRRGDRICWSWGVGEGGWRLTINMERIDSQHFTIHVNCQSPIINPGGGGMPWELCSPTIDVQVGFLDAGCEAYVSRSSAAPSSFVSFLLVHWLAIGPQFTTPLKLYFRSCCLQYWSNLLSNILRLGACFISHHTLSSKVAVSFISCALSELWTWIVIPLPLLEIHSGKTLYSSETLTSAYWKSIFFWHHLHCGYNW